MDDLLYGHIVLTQVSPGTTGQRAESQSSSVSLLVGFVKPSSVVYSPCGPRILRVQLAGRIQKHGTRHSIHRLGHVAFGSAVFVRIVD